MSNNLNVRQQFHETVHHWLIGLLVGNYWIMLENKGISCSPKLFYIYHEEGGQLWQYDDYHTQQQCLQREMITIMTMTIMMMMTMLMTVIMTMAKKKRKKKK